MDNLSHGRVIGIDVSRDWLDLHCLPDGHRVRAPNAPAGHAAVADLARDRDAVVCFESTGGQEWQLWAVLEAEGVAARQVPPAQVKAFAQSRGTRAKTDRIDAELIARFFAFRPEAGRSLPAEKLRLLRALTTKRAQLVEMRKRLLAQMRAQQKLGAAVMFEDIDAELKQRIDGLIQDLEGRIALTIADDDRLSETAGILRSIPGIGPVASSMLVAEMPEIGTITSEEAAALTGLAPVAHDSGTLRGKRAIAGGRRALRHVMFQAALVAAHHNPSLKSFADRLRKAGKPHKVIITAVARKLITIANALCKSRQKWAAPATSQIQLLRPGCGRCSRAIPTADFQPDHNQCQHKAPHRHKQRCRADGWPHGHDKGAHDRRHHGSAKVRRAECNPRGKTSIARIGRPQDRQ